jgi:DNA end-binding protein Ku
LLNEAMLTMSRVAVGRYRTRGREQLVLIRPLGRGLVLHGMHYADEVASFEDVEFGDEVQLRASELELAQQLIEQLASERFGPERYDDRYRQAVLAAVDQKIAGQDVVIAERPEEPEPIIDLMAALKRSIEARQGAVGATPAGTAARARKPALAKGKAKGGGSRRASR